MEKKCAYAAFSLNSNCSRFTEDAKDCEPRPQGLDDFITYKKNPLGTSAPLAALLGWKTLPGEGQQIAKSIGVPSDALTELVAGAQYFEYEGSLTAPPCTEEVTWLVRRTPLYMSESQSNLLNISILRATSDYGNWRAPMPLMGRQISVRQAVLGTPTASMPPPGPTGKPVQVPLAAEKTAQEAYGWAEQGGVIVQKVQAANARYGFPTALSTLAKTRGVSKAADGVEQQLLRMQAEAEADAQRSLSMGGQALHSEAEQVEVGPRRPEWFSE